ncbi:hypothetical protein [Mariniblastus fucicola]|uniref:DUF4345 domain-containing protein n=1 Tax=Mariniblastus fucicola TaxID=980251 RepID=A0A5B9PNB3_9BACT|nr:hypothetical protein [Mariniblastus fucicola]QEG23753.1 hypothetical protein MFFC18_36550 [Mariniblastus fucicola]
MIPAKIFLALTGVLYLGLALWCTVDPKTTSEEVGFQLQQGSGQSEFVTVYGGLEFALALILLMPLLWSDAVRFSLISCLTVHACLVLFRTIAYFRFEGIGSFTHRLAIGEWVILLVSVAILLTLKPPR